MAAFPRFAPPVVLAVLASLLAGCGGGQEEFSAVTPQTGQIGPLPGPTAHEVAKRCDWTVGSKRDIPESQIRKRFVDATAGARLGLLLESSEIRPGQQFAISLWNRSDERALYGTPNHVEDADTGDTIQIKGPLGFLLIGLSVEPDTAGPCVTVSVPSSTPPGDYRVVLEGVRGDGPEEDVSAPFVVAGNPLASPRWEEQLQNAARGNHERQETVGVACTKRRTLVKRILGKYPTLDLIDYPSRICTLKLHSGGVVDLMKVRGEWLGVGRDHLALETAGIGLGGKQVKPGTPCLAISKGVFTAERIDRYPVNDLRHACASRRDLTVRSIKMRDG